jgi:hypothetical protein
MGTQGRQKSGSRIAAIVINIVIAILIAPGALAVWLARDAVGWSKLFEFTRKAGQWMINEGALSGVNLVLGGIAILSACVFNIKQSNIRENAGTCDARYIFWTLMWAWPILLLNDLLAKNGWTRLFTGTWIDALQTWTLVALLMFIIAFGVVLICYADMINNWAARLEPLITAVAERRAEKHKARIVKIQLKTEREKELREEKEKIWKEKFAAKQSNGLKKPGFAKRYWWVVAAIIILTLFVLSCVYRWYVTVFLGCLICAGLLFVVIMYSFDWDEDCQKKCDPKNAESDSANGNGTSSMKEHTNGGRTAKGDKEEYDD